MFSVHAQSSRPGIAVAQRGAGTGRYRIAALLVGAAVWGVGGGYFFHTSPAPRILGKYSPKWACFLGLVLVFQVVVTWSLCVNRHRLRELLRRWLFVAVAGALLFALVAPPAYVVAHDRYLARTVFTPLLGKEHPFLQWDVPLPGSPSPDKPPGTFRIVCMGGSTTEGYLAAPGEAYPARLQRLLAEHFPDRRIEVINAGSCWHTSQHTLIKYLTNICDYRPDMIIVMHAWNDIYQAGETVFARGPFRRDYGHFLGAATRRFRPHDRFRERVFYNPLVDNFFSDFRQRPRRAFRREPVDPLAPLPSLRRNLTHLAEICEARGVQLVLASQPYLYQDEMDAAEKAVLNYGDIYAPGEAPSIQGMAQAMAVFNETSRRVARDHGLPFVELAEALPKDLRHFVDDVHWTALGYGVVAEQFFRRLDWSLLLSPAPPVDG